MPDAGDSFRLTHDASLEQAAFALFAKEVVDRGLRTLRSDNWATSARSLEGISEGTFRILGEWG